MNRSPYLFLRRTLLCAMPVLLFLGACEALLWVSGEVVPISMVARRNVPGQPPACFARMLIGQQTARYRCEQVRLLRPRLLVLGSSRVQRFRHEMFAPDAGLYTASGVVSSVADLREFLKALPADYAPKTLLLGVDPWWFNGKVVEAPGQSVAEDLLGDDALNANAHLYACQKLLKMIMNGGFNIRQLARFGRTPEDGVHRFGLGAWVCGGFRNDGSNQWFNRNTPATFIDRENPPIIERVRTGTVQFVKSTDLDSAKLAEFEALLIGLARRGTHIVGFAPPYSSAVRAGLDADAAHHAYLGAYRQQVSALFARHGWLFQDGLDPARFGLDDRCLEDGFHAMETYHVALLLAISRQPEAQEALHLQPAKLQATLADPRTTAWYPVYSP